MKKILVFAELKYVGFIVKIIDSDTEFEKDYDEICNIVMDSTSIDDCRVLERDLPYIACYSLNRDWLDIDNCKAICTDGTNMIATTEVNPETFDVHTFIMERKGVLL